MKSACVRSLSLVALLSVSAASVCAQRTPRAATATFYQTYLKLNIRGLPNPEEHKQFVSHLEASLRQLLEVARREQAKFIKEHPDEKPPWIEGDLFSSLFEGAQTFRIGATRVRGRRVEVDVRLEYKEGAEVVRWTDTLVLVREGTVWRVWDIVFKGDWQFKGGNTLRGALKPE